MIREVGVEVGKGRKLRVESWALRVGVKKLPDFKGGEIAGVDAEVVDETALETAVTEAFAEGDGVAAAAGDVFGEMIADGFGSGGLTVDEGEVPRR